MNWVLIVGQVAAIAIAIGSFLWQLRRERHAPAVDAATAAHTRTDDERIRAEMQKMADESNAWRDTRIWQLEGYLNLDAGWHLQVLTQFRLLLVNMRALKDLLTHHGVNTDHITIPDEPPPPPVIPEPPNRT